MLECAIFVLTDALSPQTLGAWCASQGIPHGAVAAFRWDDAKLISSNEVTLDAVSGAAHGAMSVELLRRGGVAVAAALFNVLSESPAARAERSMDMPAPGSYGARALENAASVTAYCDVVTRIANIGETIGTCDLNLCVITFRLIFYMRCSVLPAPVSARRGGITRQICR